MCLSFAVGFIASESNWIKFTRTADGANSELPEDLSYDSVEEVYDALKQNFDGELSQQELLDGIKKGLADASGDNYTDYFNAEDTNEFYNSLNGSFEGIGAELSLENEVIVIVAPLNGFPAEEAGLRAGDIIFKIEGEETFGMAVEEAVVKIRGEKGTTVNLTIVRDGEELEFAIVRDTIVVPSLEYELKEDNIGYLQITRFADDTPQLAIEAARSLKQQGATSIILDLRNNTGGFVDAAIAVASLWQNDEVVFEQRTGGQVTRTERALGIPLLNDLPTVVLINEGSASASEIVAGALRDNNYATLVGVQTFGKGSVQRLYELTDGSTLKVTIARWFTPGGINIDEEGVAPDIEVERSSDDFDNDLDPQLDRAIQELSS